MTKNVKAPNGRTITLVREKVNSPWSFKNSSNLNNYSINKRLTNTPEIFQNVSLARTAPAYKWNSHPLKNSKKRFIQLFKNNMIKGNANVNNAVHAIKKQFPGYNWSKLNSTGFTFKQTRILSKLKE